ncbi:hypothetical protein PMAYCL1PPCAC_05505, partial [Pristionchus mayeri]
DNAAHSESHRDTKDSKEPIRLGLRASIKPDTLSFNFAKDKHTLSFVVHERQEVTVTYKGKDAGPIPLSAKDRITVVFAHALDPKRNTNALWELHKPFAHLSYAENREYVRVLFLDDTGRIPTSATNEKSRSGMERPKIKDQRSATVRPEPPRRAVAPAPEREEDEKSSKRSDPPNFPTTPRTPARAAPKQIPTRSPSPNSRQSPKDSRRMPVASEHRSIDIGLPQSSHSGSGRPSPRDPIESLLSSVAKDASAIVCVQYPAGKSAEEGATVEEEEAIRREEGSIVRKRRDMDTEGRRDEVLRKKVWEGVKIKDQRSLQMEEMRRREEEEKVRRQRDDERRQERKRKEEEMEERKKREEEEIRAEDEDRRKKEDEAEEKAAAAKPQRRTSNEDIKQEQRASAEGTVTDYR